MKNGKQPEKGSSRILSLTVLFIALCGFSFYLGGMFCSERDKIEAKDVTSTTTKAVASPKEPTVSALQIKSVSFPECGSDLQDYTPCTDPKRWKRYGVHRLSFLERHCPPVHEKSECLIPPPDGYKPPIRWPKSRDQCWYKNVPYDWINKQKSNQHWLKKEGDKFHFPGGGTMFPRGVSHYVDQMQDLIPEMKDGTVRTAIDTGCGVASWGGDLLDRGILTISLAPRDNHEAQVQFALERGIPAILGIISTQRLPFPSNSFDMAHCSRCLIPWTEFGGIYLLEVHRIVRPGGFWVLSGPPVNYKRRWRGWNTTMEDQKSDYDKLQSLLTSMCFKKYAQKDDIAVWQKLSDKSCYDKIAKNMEAYPPKCDDSIEPQLSLRALNQNGDPLGRRDLGRNVVKWISQAMKAMASDLANAEVQGEFWELRQNAGSGLTFVIQAQPYLNAIPMPLGLEVICMKACTHYPTLFDHFQRELRDVLQDLESKNVLENWKETQSWKLLKEIANSAQHREVARKAHQPKPVAGVFGMDSEKVKAIQARIDEFTSRMSQLLQVERDTELEVTQEELDVIPTPDESSDSSKPIEFLVRHGEAPQELCDTICNLYAVSTSTGLGGMHLVLFKVGGNHRLPPTTLSPGDMVCIRICDSKGAGATSCTQGFVHNLGDDGCSIGVALESRHGDPTFSKLFGKSVRIDRIHGLADALTYERNCEALMLLQKNGLQKKNPSISVVATLFGDGEDITWLEQNDYVDWSEAELSDEPVGKLFDDSQRRAIALGVNKKRPVMIVQGPPGTGKTGMLKEVITLAVQQGERVLVTAPTNAAVDNMVEKLSHLGLNIVRVGNPARISSAVASKSLGEIVNSKLASFRAELERKKSDLRKDLRQCLRDDSLAAGIRQLLKQLGKALKKKEKETVKEILSNAQVVFATNIGAADPLIRRLETFDLVVIDEAGQSIEPSCWIPILQGKRCILAGDPCQLAPVVLSRKALEDGLGVSLLERAASLHDGLLSTKLTTQYRMNDVIAGWASKEMYGGWLKSAPSVASHLLIDSPFVKPTWITQCPLLLLDTRMPYGSLSMGCEERLDPAGTGSLYNEGEADIVVNHVISLIYAGVSPMAIAVQSPYVAQVQLLRERLDDFPVADGVEVATIDSFQGREADAVIISMVRSNNLGAVGFLGDSRRMNVAITRARKHVAVVCDSSTICHNTFLARLLRHIRYFGRVKHADPGSLGGSGLGLDPMLPYLG